MEDIEYLDEYKDLVLPGIKNSDVRQSGGARRRRISSDSSNSSSLDADIFQKLFLDKSVDDDLLNLTEGVVSKSQSRRHRSPSSSDDSNDALDALFNRKLKTKPNKRRERFSSFDSVDDLGQALMRSTQRMTVPKPSTSQARAKKSHSDALYRSSSSSNSSARGKSTSRKSRPAVASSSGKSAAAAAAAPSFIGKYRNPSKPSSVNGSSNAGKGKAVTILKAQKTDLRPAKHEPKTDPLNLIEFFEDTDSDSSYSYESDFFDDNDSADEDVEPVIDISTDTSRTTSVADTVTPVVSDDDGQEPQREREREREQDEESEQNGQNERSQSSIMNIVYERLQSYLNNLSCAEAPPIYKKQSFAKKSRSSEKKPSSSEQVKHAKERSPASGKVQEEKERDQQDREPTKFSASSPSSPAKSAAHSTKSLEDKSSASASRRLFEVDDDITLETLHRMTQDLAEQILEIDVERSVEYQKRSGSKHRSRSRSKISGEPGTASDLTASHVRKLTYSSERLNSSEHLDNGSEPLGTQLRRSKSESAFPKRGGSQGKKERKTRAATTEDNVLSSAKEGEAEVPEPVPVKRKRGRPRKKQKINKVKSTESVQEPVAKDQEVLVETSGVEAVKEQEPEERELNSELEKAKDFAGFASQDDISMSSCHQETDLKCAPDRNFALDEDAARNLKKEPQPTVDTSTESFDTAMDTSEITESVTRPKECLPEPEKTQEDHPTDATMAIKDLEEIENAIETAGEIAMTPELADALDASTNVQAATQVAGNILEESDSQLAEDIKLAEEILAAEVGKGIEVTEAAEATEVRDQDPVIDIVKELEQETITEVMGNSEESSSHEGQTELAEESSIQEKSPPKGRSLVKGQSPVKDHSPAKEHTPVNRQSSVKDHSPVKEPSPEKEPSSADKQTLKDEQITATKCSEDQGNSVAPSSSARQPEAKEKSPIKEISPFKSRSPAMGQSPAKAKTPVKGLSQAKAKSPVKGQSQSKESLPPEAEPSSADEQSLEKGESTAQENSEVHGPSTAEEQMEEKEKSPDIKSQVPTKEDPPRLDTPTKRTNPSTPAKIIEVEEATSSVARRSLRSDKPESKPGTPETTPIKQSARKSRAKLPLKSELTFLKDDSSRRSSPRLGRSPAESHSSQERPKLAKEKPITESKSPVEQIEPKDNITVEASNPVEDVPVTDSTIIAEEKPSSDETDANKVDVKSSKKKGKKRKSMAKLTEELPHTPKQSTSSESEQRDEPPEIQANDTSELPAEQSKASESKADNSEAENIDEKPSSSRKSRSRRSRWDQLKPESDSHTESSEVEREKIQLRTSSRGSNIKPETKTDDSSGKKEQISTKVSREDKLKTDASKTPAKPHSSRSRGTTKDTSKNDKAEENESSRERSVKSKSETVSMAKKRKNKSLSQMQVDDSSDQTETEPEKRLTEANSKKSKSKAVLNSTDPDPNAKESTQDQNDKEKSKNRKSKGTNEPKENIDIETAADVEGKTEPVSLTAPNSAEDLPKPSSKAESAEVKDKPDKPIKVGRIKNRKQAVSIENSENDQIETPSQLDDTILDPEPIPPPRSNKESEKEAVVPEKEAVVPEKEAVVSGPQKKSKKKQRKSKATISASAKDSKDSVSITTPAEPISAISETKPEEPSQTDAKPTSRNSPSKIKDNVPEEEKDSESNTKPKSPSTNLSCRKLRVLLKRTPTSNLMSISKTVGRKGTSNKRKKFNKLLQRIEEDAASELVDTPNKPNLESQSVSESDSVPEATEKATCDVQKNVPKKAIDDVKEEVPKETTTVTDIQEKVEKITQELEADKPEEPVSENSTDNAKTTETPVEQKHDNETSNPSGADEVSQEETTKKQTQEEEEIHKEEEAPEVESTCHDEDIPKGQETPEDMETDIDVETTVDEETHKDQETPGEEGATKDLEPSEESLTEDCTDSDSQAPEIAPTEAPASPTQDSTETETTGVTVVAPEEDSTNSRVKRSMRKREADSSQPDDAIKLKQHLAMKSTLERKRQLLKNAARRRKQQAEQDHSALKRTKTDPAVSKPSERGKTISMIGNETIMTSPSVETTRSEQPQTSQAAKRTAAASKGPNYAEITKHVIIPAPGKKPVDAKPPGSLTKKPMVQTLLSSTLNLRKPLPEEETTSTSGSRKSLGKVEVDGSKAKSQATLNNSLVLTKKAVLPASKKNESPTKEDKSAAIALRKVNISVSLIPSKDNLANTSSSNKSLETSPVLTRKVQLVEAQKTARKSEAKKKVDSKVAEPEIQSVSPLDKSKLKVMPKSAVAVDTSAKKIDSQAVPARKSLPVEVPKKTETRKSEGQSLNSRKAPPKADAPLKIETRKSEGAQLARKVIPSKGSVVKELEPQKPTAAKDEKPVESADTSATEEVVTELKGRETANKAIAEQRKESSALLRIEKPTVAVTPRTVSLAKSMHMTRAASSSRSLAPTPTPVREEQQTASTERLSLPSTESLPEPPRPLRKGRNIRVTAALKRKAPGAAEASDSKRAKAEQEQVQEGSDHESRSMAFPVKITAAGLDQQLDPLSNPPLVSKKQAVKKTPVQEERYRKLRIRVNRHVVTQWLKDQQAKKKVLTRKVLAPVDDVASDTESAAESMTESFNSSRPEPPVRVLVPPVPLMAPIKDLVPPVAATEAPAETVLAEVSVTSAPVPPVSVPPDSVPPDSEPPAPVLPATVPPPVLAAPVPPAPDSEPPTLPSSLPATEAVKTPVAPPLTAKKGPNETKTSADAKRLAALKKVQMHTTLPMPLPVPITVPEVKSEPEDEPPQPMEEDAQEAQPLVAAPQPVPEAPLVAQSTPSVDSSSRQVISVTSASNTADRPAPSDIPSASAPGNNANSFGNTKMFSFLYPNRHSGNYGEVGLDFCCPNLEGPMVAIDPTRLHAKVEAPVLEMPQFLVITTKFISKADKNIPNKVRAKLELLGKDKELSAIERPTTVPDPPALAALASPVPIPQSLPSEPPLPAAPPIVASSSTPTPTAPASSIDSQLPRGTILTKKALPSGAPAPSTASDSVAPSPPLSLIQLPTLCPTDQLRTELQARVQMFDLVLQSLSRRVANLTVVERQRTIEEIVKTSTLMPIDVDVGTKLLENYVHYLNKATSSTPVPPLPSEVKALSGTSPATPVVAQIPPTAVASSTPAVSQNIVSPATTTAAPQPDKIVIRKPIYDGHKNVIGFKSVTSPNVKAPVSTSSRRSAPGSASAATSTPLAASTSAAAAAASADSRFVEVDSKTVKACQRQMINLRAPAQKSAVKSSIIAIKPGSKAKTPVGKAASAAIQKPAASPAVRGHAASPAIRGPAGPPAIRGPAVSPASRCPPARGPASRTPATLRGPPPLKPATSPGAVRRVGSVPLAAPSLTRTANPNVFIINQASHVEESILPDSNNVVAPMEAEIKGELDDSTEVII